MTGAAGKSTAKTRTALKAGTTTTSTEKKSAARFASSGAKMNSGTSTITTMTARCAGAPSTARRGKASDGGHSHGPAKKHKIF